MGPRVQTVLGDVDPTTLGNTLTHEHMCMDFTHFYRKPSKDMMDEFKSQISLLNIGYIRQYPYSSRYNLVLNDMMAKSAVINDVHTFKKYGGGTIVENSTEGLERQVNFCKEVSLKTGVNVVAGTGYYIADTQSINIVYNTTEELCNHMTQELTIGCMEDLSVRAGFMGEIASVWPLRDFERKAIQAAGEIQSAIGCGVSFHPHRDVEAPFEIIRLYLEAGGKAEKAVMSHLDRTILDNDKLLEFAELGTYCQFDLFGTEVSYYQLRPDVDMISDAQRIDKIKLLVEEGRTERVLMSHDIHTKHRLTNFGGHGYSHILTNILPRMKAKGLSNNVINTITVENPARWLTIENDS